MKEEQGGGGRGGGGGRKAGHVEIWTVSRMTAVEPKAGDVSSDGDAGVGLVSLASSGLSALHA